MLSDFPLSAKSVHKLANKGLCLQSMKEQLGEELDFSLELWRAQGLDIVKDRGYYYFASRFISIDDAEFCIVDIETNGSKIDKHQIIEIASVKVKNGTIIDRYESLVHCKEINEFITVITGIRAEDTKDSPNLKRVLYEFKTFLGDAIFVAHDVKFDYKFISQSMQKVGLEPLLNRPLCSLSLAQRTVISYRYALSYLSESLGLNPNATHHRAMSDVITTYELFKLSMKNLDKEIKSVENLIKFSNHGKRLKRPKFDPLSEDSIKT
ncbi:MAG: 3'-5' exonuclease [Campylobacterota bacterium]|nr:3'-5' exonuclease [Campylobacterota bacterium]